MKRGKRIYQSWLKERKKAQTFSRRFIGMCWVVCPVLGIISVIGSGYSFITIYFSLMSLACLAVGTIFVLYGSKELCVYENGILIPYGLTRKFLRFSDISKIKLNTTHQSFVSEIEIFLGENDVVKYKKTLIHDWKTFYKTMLFGVAGRVKVVE